MSIILSRTKISGLQNNFLRENLSNCSKISEAQLWVVILPVGVAFSLHYFINTFNYTACNLHTRCCSGISDNPAAKDSCCIHNHCTSNPSLSTLGKGAASLLGGMTGSGLSSLAHSTSSPVSDCTKVACLC